MKTSNFWTETDIISTYTRADAIADGVLVDVTYAAKETGFCLPVSLTRAVWEDCVRWSENDDARKGRFTGQDWHGRLHDVLWMAYLAARAQARGLHEENIINFSLFRVPRIGKGFKARRVTLKMVCGPGDDAEPVLTIMLPSED